MGERLIFRRLVLVGPTRDYEVAFRNGVNVIAGPVMTGKSTVLRLLDYAMGSGRKPEIPELAKCSAVFVECVIGGEIVTIERSLRQVSAQATVYDAALNEIRANNPKGLIVTPRQTKGQQSISSEVMRRLGLGELEVKASPTQAASDLSTFSLRDLFSLIYLDQTRISDDRSAFFEREPPKSIKWKAGVEIVHELFDDTAAQLARALVEAQTEEQEISRFLDTARQFLDEAQIASADALSAELKTIEDQRTELLRRQVSLRDSAEAELGENLILVHQRDERADEIANMNARVMELERTLAQLGRLRVQYERERAQLEFLQESERLIASLPVVRCPACLQGVEHGTGTACYVCGKALSAEPESVSVDSRLRAVRRRVTDLEAYIDQLAATLEQLSRSRGDAQQEMRRLANAITRVQQTTLLPSGRVLAEVGEALSLVERRRSAAREQLFLRERAQGQGSALLAVRERVRRLGEEQAVLARSTPQVEKVVAALAKQFRQILTELRFPYLDGLGIDPKTYYPVVRGAPYAAVSSKGAVSLVVTAWHLALLSCAFEEPSRFPMVLLLDSPLSHVGRDATDPEFKDQQIVDAFYTLLGRLHSERADAFQLIMCDNHPPDDAQGLVTIEFTGDPNSGRGALIDDE